RYHDPPVVYTRRSHDVPSTTPQEVSTHDPSHMHDNVILDCSNRDDLPIALRKGKRQCTLHPISQVVSTDHLGTSMLSFTSALSAQTIPLNHHQALLDSSWRQAMQEEIDALKSRGAWELVELPPSSDVGSK
ncbi:hypothetical protein QML37_31450, partial [Klebsiella pneumoniae]|uniref:hypothetical protein n=1 Tax=Klebsiella pneumoniae TaxID=573 RepID=UPI003A7F669C